MTLYLDASVVVSLFVHDGHTARADDWIRRTPDPIAVSDLCAIEYAAAVSRGVSMERLSSAQAQEALADFDEWRSKAALSLHLAAKDVELADALVRDFTTKLAAADAMHLAVAMNAAAILVTFDQRLAAAAHARGAPVATP